MNKLLALALSAVFGMSMFFTYAGPVMAGEGMMAGESCPLPSFTGPSQYSGYMGALALDREQNELGRVVDVTTGGGSDQWVDFLIVSSCLPGMNGRLVAIPYTAVESYSPVGTVVTAVTKEDFQNAPSISSDDFHGVGWGKWVQDDYNHFAKNFEKSLF